jgi:hypothetical protein
MALAVVLRGSRGVMFLVPILFLLSNFYEVIASNRRVGFFYFLVIIRSVFQLTFVSLIVFTKLKIVATALGLIYLV